MMDHQDPDDIIARLWEGHRGVVAERLATIAVGIDAVVRGESRMHESVVQAHRASHNLAGALGSYGRPEGSVHARELMDAFTDPASDPSRLRALLNRVKEACV